MIVQEGLLHRGDLPVGHLALVHVGGVAHRHGSADAPRDLEQPGGVLERSHDQRRTTQGILWIGKAELEVDHNDAGLLTRTNGDLAIAAALVIVGHSGFGPTISQL
jgi:hypothetical protein